MKSNIKYAIINRDNGNIEKMCSTIEEAKLTIFRTMITNGYKYYSKNPKKNGKTFDRLFGVTEFLGLSIAEINAHCAPRYRIEEITL